MDIGRVELGARLFRRANASAVRELPIVTTRPRPPSPIFHTDGCGLDTPLHVPSTTSSHRLTTDASACCPLQWFASLPRAHKQSACHSTSLKVAMHITHCHIARSASVDQSAVCSSRISRARDAIGQAFSRSSKCTLRRLAPADRHFVLSSRFRSKILARLSAPVACGIIVQANDASTLLPTPARCRYTGYLMLSPDATLLAVAGRVCIVELIPRSLSLALLKATRLPVRAVAILLA